jgi:hypothetical protein
LLELQEEVDVNETSEEDHRNPVGVDFIDFSNPVEWEAYAGEKARDRWRRGRLSFIATAEVWILLALAAAIAAWGLLLR